MSGQEKPSPEEAVYLQCENLVRWQTLVAAADAFVEAGRRYMEQVHNSPVYDRENRSCLFEVEDLGLSMLASLRHRTRYSHEQEVYDLDEGEQLNWLQNCLHQRETDSELKNAIEETWLKRNREKVEKYGIHGRYLGEIVRPESPVPPPPKTPPPVGK